jgi:hypothetical protein
VGATWQPWDYAQQLHEAFLPWVAEVTALGVRVLNTPRLLQLGAHRGYLTSPEWAAAGVDVVRTLVLSPQGLADGTAAAAVASEVGEWQQQGDVQELVVKPAVGSSIADDTRRFQVRHWRVCGLGVPQEEILGTSVVPRPPYPTCARICTTVSHRSLHGRPDFHFGVARRGRWGSWARRLNTHAPLQRTAAMYWCRSC